MRKLFLLFLTWITAACLFFAADAASQTHTIRQAHILQPAIAEEVLRFHVRANSDSFHDQQLKMKVKSTVLEYLQPLLRQSEDVQSARQILERNQISIKQLAESVLIQESEAQKTVRVDLTESYFPEKTYGDCTFPAGVYQALVIELGSGTGHNWWCMLYPGLCFVDESYAVVPEEEKKKLKEELPEDAYEWITKKEKRKCTFFWNKWQEIFDCAKIRVSF